MRRIPMAVLLGALALATPASAQRTSLLLRLPASARALALSDHLPAGRVDAAGMFYEPAFLQGDAGVYAGGQRYGGGAFAMDAAGAVSWLGGVAGVGLRSVDYNTAFDPRVRQVLPADLEKDEGDVAVSERAVSITYAHRLKRVRLGGSAKLVEERVGADHGSGVAFDASAGATLGLVRVGLSALNIGPDIEVGGGDMRLPQRYTASLTGVVPIPAGPIDWTPVLALSREWNGRIAPAFGLELAYWPIAGRTFYARGGLRRPPEERTEPFTLGAGFSGDKISIDYAYEPFDEAHGAHRIGIRWGVER